MSELGKKFDIDTEKESQAGESRPQMAKILERLEHIERKLDILLTKSDSGGGPRPFRSDRGPRREFGGGGGGFRGGRDRGPRREFGGGGRDRGFGRPDRDRDRGGERSGSEGRGGHEERGGEGRGGAEPWKERYKPFFDKKKPFFGDKKKRHRD